MRNSLLYILCFVYFLPACSSYPGRIADSRHAFEMGNYEVATESLKNLAEKKDSDELLLLLELGVAYHTAGNYEQAISTFQQAEKLSDLTSYTSLSQEAGSVLLNDTIKTYRLDDYEKVLISAYLAMDYTFLKKWESALVECRRINHQLDQMIAAGNVTYQKNAFAKYLAALLFENENEYNDAWVDYRLSAEWLPGLSFHSIGLLRMADQLNASQELNDYKKRFPGVTDYRLQRGQGELVVLAEVGRAPFKVEDPSFRLIPLMVRNSYFTDHIELRDLNAPVKARTEILYDIETTAIQELEEKRATLVAKKMGGIVAKQATAYGVEKVTKSPQLGALSALILHLSDRPDLRNWSFLPANLQLLRVKLPAGRHDIVLDRVLKSGQKEEWKTFKNIEIQPRKISFLNVRVVD